MRPLPVGVTPCRHAKLLGPFYALHALTRTPPNRADGWDSNQLWDKRTHSLRLSRDVTFDESVFPFKQGDEPRPALESPAPVIAQAPVIYSPAPAVPNPPALPPAPAVPAQPAVPPALPPA